MHSLLSLSQRYHSNKTLLFILWCIIAVGIVPAIVTENILPFNLFSYRFGTEIELTDYLPKSICLLMFIIGITFCVVQRRYWMILLLLPWLALILFQMEQLTVRLPSYSQTQDVLRANYQASKEHIDASQLQTLKNEIESSSQFNSFPFLKDPTQWLCKIAQVNASIAKDHLKPLQVQTLQAKLEQIKQPNNPILPIDVNKTGKTLQELSAQKQQSEFKSVDQQMRLICKINALNIKISATDTQIDEINSAKNFPFFQHSHFDEALQHVFAQRSTLTEQRSQLRAELNAIEFTNLRLYELHAEIKAAHWASEVYTAWRYSQAYKVACFLVLLVLIYNFSLSSWVFLITLGVSLLVSWLYIEAPPIFRLWVLIKFVLTAWVIRALCRFAVENYPLLRRQSRTFLLRTFIRALGYYWLFLLLIGLTVFVSVTTDRHIDAIVYSFDSMSEFEPGKNPRRQDIDAGIDNYFATQENTARNRLDALLDKKPIPGVDAVAVETNAIYDETFKPTLPAMNRAFSEKGCKGAFRWILDTVNCAENAVKHPFNQFYLEKRRHYAQSLQTSTDQYSRNIEGGVHEAVAIAKQDLHQNFLDMRLELKAQLHRFYSVIDFWYWTSLLIFTIVILKSFFYIYARLFFASNRSASERVIQFEPKDQPLQNGHIKELRRVIKLNKNFGETLFINKKYDFSNAPPDEVTPQAHKALFSRRASKTWHLNRIRPITDGSLEETLAPYWRIPDDERMIVWHLQPGDAVIFSWRNFVGMNQNIDIKTQFSWQLSSLLLGRMFYVVAQVDANSNEEGVLILSARNSDGIIENSRPASSPDQLLAWQTTTRFHLFANLSMRNVYRSGIQIRAVEKDLAVMHQDSRKRKSGAASFIKYFLIPV